MTPLELRNIGFQYDFLESFVGISIAHAAHGFSVLALYNLARALFTDEQGRKLAFVAACLHIISPAGLFLSAPYGESAFAFFSFSGCLLFVRSFEFRKQSTPLQDLLVAVSGLVLGFATMVRSNGLLYGLLFLEEAIKITYFLIHRFTLTTMRRLAAVSLGGLFVAVGFLLPQFIAFQQFCTEPLATNGPPARIWCTRTFPSIYTFVQDHYWQVQTST